MSDNQEFNKQVIEEAIDRVVDVLARRNILSEISIQQTSLGAHTKEVEYHNAPSHQFIHFDARISYMGQKEEFDFFVEKPLDIEWDTNSWATWICEGFLGGAYHALGGSDMGELKEVDKFCRLQVDICDRFHNPEKYKE